MSTTTVAVDQVDGHPRVRMRHGLLRAQRLHGRPEVARVALVGQTALLLGGDVVELEITVGPGAVLELSEVAATVAYDGRGRAAQWRTTVGLATGAHLTWSSEPLVIADGADVTRSTVIDLAHDATAAIRETIILGRAGERGGRLRSGTRISRADRPLLVEDLVLDPVDRAGPGLLGDRRVIDSLLLLGTGGPEGPAPAATAQFRLLEPGSTLTRFLGFEAADSPLPGPRTARAGMLQE